MKFYRKATEKDFELDFNLPEPVKEILENGTHLNTATIKLRELSGMGMLDCRRECQVYESYLKARVDFQKGELVMVEY